MCKLFHNALSCVRDVELLNKPSRTFALLALAGALAAALLLARGAAPTHAAPTGTSVIVLIGDGMGPAQRSATQLARYGLDVTQPMDALPVSGSIRTQAAGTAITDSAAGATAIATGVKTRNGYMGVGPGGERLTTLLEIARDAGKATGLVEDADVTNATTGSFASHVKNRDLRRTVARQYLHDTRPDVMLGGGEEIWCKRGTPGAIPNDLPEDRCRSKTDLIAEAQSLGYQYASDAEGVAAATGPKVLGLVQRDPYVRELLADYDRKEDPHYVPEEQLVAKAIEILSQDPDGFFLAIDVDEIDVGGHASHAGLVIKSADLLNRIVSTVEAYRATDPNLLFVVTADHETGGMTIEGPKSNSTDVLGYPIPRRWRNGPFEIEGTDELFTTDWTTPGHTGVAVPLTAAGPGAEQLRGTNDNTDVFEVARGVLTGNP
jgi:alkaline phosphatase